MKLQKITPFLWFNYEAAEAAIFYTSVFKKFTNHYYWPDGYRF